jgi:hypothetical protein
VLEHPRVVALLAGLPHGRFCQLDTGTEREVFDVGFLDWSTIREPNVVARVRLIVTRRTLTYKEHSPVGYRVGAVLYELFVTDLDAEGFTACDVLDLYFSRGGFERTLSQEDRELASDRWVSGNPYGQELWQILCQWVWNKRIKLGLQQAPTPVRITHWREAIEPPARSPEASPDHAQPDIESVPQPTAPSEPAASTPPEPVSESNPETVTASPNPAAESELTSDAPHAAPPDPQPHQPLTLETERIRPSALQQSGRAGLFGPRDFRPQPDGTLTCPAGKRLRPGEHQHRKTYDLVRFAAKAIDCQTCEQLDQCMPARPCGSSGRRLTLPLLPRVALGTPPSSLASSGSALVQLSPPLPGPLPILWRDLPSAFLRRTFIERLRDQRVDVDLAPYEPVRAPAMITRDERAHRRLSWASRFARNARPTSRPPTYRVYGLSLPPASRLTAAGVFAAA